MASIFFSYASEDRSAAKEAHDALEADGADCSIAPDDIPAGADWPAAIFSAIKQSGAMVLIFSKSANRSEDVNRELLLARQHKVPVLPFFLEDITPDGASGYHLTNLQFIHAYRMSPDEAHRALRGALETRRLVEPRTPSAPARTDADLEAPLPAYVQFRDQDWESLLDSISDGNAVPIIGPELLEVTVEGQQVHLYTYLAQRLADVLRVPWEFPPHTAPLASVVSRFLRQGGDTREVYSGLKALFPESDRLGVAEPLRQLAGIDALRLFVTTTCDSLMERALRDERPDKAITVLAFSPRIRADDLPDRHRSSAGSIVYHIFGRLSAAPTYAVTEEDTQETFIALESGGPARLLRELAGQQILLLGTNLPEWLARSFVRLVQRGGHRQLPTIIADNRLHWDPGFRGYLEQSTQRLRVYADGAVPFVQELLRRWNITKTIIAIPRRPSGDIYLSFAPADVESARKLSASLAAEGLEAWLGSSSGAESINVIRGNIERSAVFVPIISRRTASLTPAVFREEWELATEAARRLPSDTTFIVPVVIDDQPPESSGVPERFRELNWVKVDPTNVDPALVIQVKQLVRKRRLADQR